MIFNGKRYIVFYDNHGLEMLANSGVWVFDQRLNNQTALKRAYDRIQVQAAAYLAGKDVIKPRQCYCRVYRDNDVLVDTRILENPIYQ